MTLVNEAAAQAKPGQKSTPVVEVDNLTVSFGKVRAVQEVSLSVYPGEVYALVGESGCGKSTLASALLHIVAPPALSALGRSATRGAASSE